VKQRLWKQQVNQSQLSERSLVGAESEKQAEEMRQVSVLQGLAVGQRVPACLDNEKESTHYERRIMKAACVLMSTFLRHT
jgi:hypothetical protein